MVFTTLINGACFINSLNNFEQSLTFAQSIPCFARDELLNKLGINRSVITTAYVHLETRHGFCFLCRIRNEEDRTFFTGGTWREFAKVYQLEVGMEMSIRLGGKHKHHLRVRLSTDPITHPSYYGVDIVTKHFIDNMEVTEGSRVTWEEMWFVVGFVDQIWMLADGYNAGPRDHSYVPLLHKLNKTNIDDRLMILPQHVVPKEMGANGELTIVLHPRVNISSTSYSASGQGDGSIILNGWSKVVDVYDMDVGDRMIFVLHHGHVGMFLFLGFIAAEPDEE